MRSGLPAKYAKMGFKRGWRAYKSARGSRRMSGEVYDFPGVSNMSGSRKKRKKYGTASRWQKKHHRLNGEVVTFAGERDPVKRIMKLFSDGAIAVGGAVAANAVSNLLPGPVLVRAAAPLAMGAIASFVPVPIVQTAGLGMVAGGGLNLVRKYLGPTVPALAGEGDDDLSPDELREAIVTGEVTPSEALEIADAMESQELLGVVEEFAGEASVDAADTFSGEGDGTDFDLDGDEYDTDDTESMQQEVDQAAAY